MASDSGASNGAAQLKLRNLKRRFDLEKQMRLFFWSHDFTETRTPLLVQSPGLEPHICPIEIKNPHSARPVFLPTSPEFGMKKLLAQGFTKIFQICPAFRNEPNSPEHSPEFTLLEFYEAHSTLTQLQSRIEDLFYYLGKYSNPQSDAPLIHYKDQKINLSKNWPRFRINDLFLKHLDLDLRTLPPQEKSSCITLAQFCKNQHLIASADEAWDDLYFKLWLNCIEPKLPRDRPCFVTHYPLSQSSLCNSIADETGFLWANRFEVYVGNLEIGNAFDELRDPALQRKNFEEDQKTRQNTYQGKYPESPIDDSFIEAISHMPPSCGIAMGVDRICMLFLNISDISLILPQKSYWG